MISEFLNTDDNSDPQKQFAFFDFILQNEELVLTQEELSYYSIISNILKSGNEEDESEQLMPNGRNMEADEQAGDLPYMKLDSQSQQFGPFMNKESSISIMTFDDAFTSKQSQTAPKSHFSRKNITVLNDIQESMRSAPISVVEKP